jgi:purine catabolism regulator
LRLTLREALTLAEPLRQARVIAGAGGLDNVVRSVNVMEVPDILEWVHPGELLVTTMYPLRDDRAAIEALIPRLAEKGLAGLAVTVESYIGELPPAMLADANRLNFPLIELPPRVSFIDIIQPLTSRILDLQAEELRQSEQILRRFLDLVLVGGDYSSIAQVITEVAGHPVSIVDRFRRVLGSGGELETPWEMALIEKDAAGDSYIKHTYEPMSTEEIPGHSARRARATLEGGTLEHVVCPIEVSSAELGSVIVWGRLPLDVESRALMAIEHGATVVALKMMERLSISQVEQQFRNEILEGLLSDQAIARQNAVQLSERLGNRLLPPFVVVVVGPDVPSDTLLAHRERSEQSSVEASLHLARRYIRVLREGATFWRKGPQLIVFLPISRREASEIKDALVDRLRSVCARIESENAPYTVSIGVSRIAETVDGFRQAYGDARHSFEVGRALGGRTGSHVAHFDGLGLFRFVPTSESATTLKEFCEDVLGPLLARDRGSSSRLVETLRVFLAQNQNHAEAARALGVHYNTVRYRLARIKDIVGDVFSNPQRRLTLEVALHLYPLLSRADQESRPQSERSE